jgi:A/G-specific adenine glycosylase
VATELEQLKKSAAFKKMLGNAAFIVHSISRLYSQKLTHQTIHGQFIKITLKKPAQLDGYEPVSEKEMAKLPFPKFITSYLKDKNVSLNLL